MADKCLLSPLYSWWDRHGGERLIVADPGQPQLPGSLERRSGSTQSGLMEPQGSSPGSLGHLLGQWWSRVGMGTIPRLVLSRGGSQKHLPNAKPQDTSPLPLCSRSGQRRSFIMGKLTPMEIKPLSPAGSAASDLATCRAGLTPCPHVLEERHPHRTSLSLGSHHHILLCWGLNVLLHPALSCALYTSSLPALPFLAC